MYMALQILRQWGPLCGFYEATWYKKHEIIERGKPRDQFQSVLLSYDLPHLLSVHSVGQLNTIQDRIRGT